MIRRWEDPVPFTDEQRETFHDEVAFAKIPMGYKKNLLVLYKAELEGRTIANMDVLLVKTEEFPWDDEKLIQARKELLKKAN